MNSKWSYVNLHILKFQVSWEHYPLSPFSYIYLHIANRMLLTQFQTDDWHGTSAKLIFSPNQLHSEVFAHNPQLNPESWSWEHYLPLKGRHDVIDVQISKICRVWGGFFKTDASFPLGIVKSWIGLKNTDKVSSCTRSRQKSKDSAKNIKTRYIAGKVQFRSKKQLFASVCVPENHSAKCAEWTCFTAFVFMILVTVQTKFSYGTGKAKNI